MSVLFARWSFWWFAAWVGIAIWTQAAAESCRKTIMEGGVCSGFNQTAYDNPGALFIGAVVVAIAGGIVLSRAQDRADSRPCPRCGHRVPVGILECAACGHDFAR